MREVDRAAQAGVHPVHKHVLIAWALLWTLLVYAPPRPLRRRGLVALLLVSLPLLSGPPSPWLPRPAGVSARPHVPGRGLRPGPAGAAVRAAHGRAAGRTRTHGRGGQSRGLLASPPSVSADAIAHALHAAGSPLAAARRLPDGRTLAQDLWDRGQAVGIDPAVVMALFWHESHYGTPGHGGPHPQSVQQSARRGRGPCSAAPTGVTPLSAIGSLGSTLCTPCCSSTGPVGRDHTRPARFPIWAPSSD